MTTQSVVGLPNPEDAKAVFFKGMLEGYVNKKHSTSNLRSGTVVLPGWKTYKYRDHGYLLVDMWHTNPNLPHSTGVTILYFENMPIWVMHYGGWYHDDAISTLRHALKWNYERNLFVGGRGPTSFSTTDKTYQNQVAESSSFINFDGSESVFDNERNKLLGEHWYRGQWLLV